MVDKTQLLSEIKAYLGDSLPSMDEYAAKDDAPYSVIQIRRIFGSWDRFLSLLAATEAEVKVTKVIEKAPVTKGVK